MRVLTMLLPADATIAINTVNAVATATATVQMQKKMLNEIRRTYIYAQAYHIRLLLSSLAGGCEIESIYNNNNNSTTRCYSLLSNAHMRTVWHGIGSYRPYNLR